jgi:hypothetical protein
MSGIEGKVVAITLKTSALPSGRFSLTVSGWSRGARVWSADRIFDASEPGQLRFRVSGLNRGGPKPAATEWQSFDDAPSPLSR